MVFEYYILRLGEHEFIMSFIATQGFESLAQLIIALGKRKTVAVTQ